MAKVSKRRPVKKKSRTASDNSVVSRISPVAKEEGGMTISLYGTSGTGKTTLVSSFRKPLMLVDCHAGTKSIHNIKGIDTVRLQDCDELDDVVEHQHKTGKYKTFVVDHATSFQDLILMKILGLEEVPRQLSWGTASQSQWGDVAAGMKEKLGRVLDLADGKDCDVIMVSQQRTMNADSDSSELLDPYITAAVSPSTAGWLHFSCDYVLQTFLRMHEEKIEKKLKSGKVLKKRGEPTLQYCLRLQPHPIYASKFRAPKGSKVPEVLVDPTYAKLIKFVEGDG